MARVHAETYQPTSEVESDSLVSRSLYGSDLVSILDLSVEQIKFILSYAKKIKSNLIEPIPIKNKIVAHCFFEPSTRTRMSFESATLRMGGHVIGFSGQEGLSVKKGETLQDTMRMLANYADLIVMRHPNEGAARLAAEVSNKPVINAGDGSNQHPTQTLIDLFSIEECQGRLDGLSIALVGDLKNGRTIHSFLHVCRYFDIRLFLVSPSALMLPQDAFEELKQTGVRFSIHQSISEIVSKVDILYMTRIQQERMNAIEVKSNDGQYVLTPDMLENVKPNLKILHPLPRVKEIDVRVDAMSQAYYFNQAANAVCVRQALLSLLLNESIL